MICIIILPVCLVLKNNNIFFYNFNIENTIKEYFQIVKSKKKKKKYIKKKKKKKIYNLIYFFKYYKKKKKKMDIND